MPRRRPEAIPHRRLGLWLALAALASAAFLALTVPDKQGSDAGNLSVLLADGTLEHDNSRDGAAILTASGIWPGWSGDGDVTITNTGSAGSWLRLTQAAVDDLPGPAGGQLSDQLDLVVEDVTVPGFAVPVYSGPLGSVGEQWLGRMEPGDERTYRFHTEMPSSAGDNDYQASAVSVRFEWAVSDTDPSDPSGPPVDPPPPSGGGGGGGGDGGSPAAGDAPASDPLPGGPPASDPPAGDDPAPDPPAEEPVQVVPDGSPVVVVNRGRLDVKLAVPTRQRPLRRRSLTLLVSCSRSCRTRIGGKLGVVKGRASRLRAGRGARVLSAGVQKRVKLRISRRALRKVKRRLARGRAVRGRVTVVVRDRSGRRARAKQRIRLVPVRRR